MSSKIEIRSLRNIGQLGFYNPGTAEKDNAGWLR
jgi:hypothetical protein